MTARLSIELGLHVGVARHKPCRGCGVSWSAAAGRWLDAGATSWLCDDCVEPVDYCTCTRPGCRNRAHVTAAQMFAVMSGRTP